LEFLHHTGLATSGLNLLIDFIHMIRINLRSELPWHPRITLLREEKNPGKVEESYAQY
jgi:hypothetical protein